MPLPKNTVVDIILKNQDYSIYMLILVMQIGISYWNIKKTEISNWV